VTPVAFLAMPSPPPVPPPGSLRLKFVNALTTLNTAAYRKSGGRIGGKLSGAPILLLDHVGRKSGRRRTSPLMYTRDRDDLIIVASRGGSEAMPAWWHNLKAEPRTTVQVGSEHRQVVASEAQGAERERLWPLVVDTYRDYAVYQERTDRVLPVIVLRRPAD
jgi:deazaflavin-dependent oxidoreductase (nitroreductase family)